jgi:hypothetical protein
MGAMPNIDPWLCQNLICPPSTHGQLIVLELICMVMFGLIALVMAAVHAAFSRAFALLYVCRSGIGNGAAFPLSILFIFYPVSENVRGLVTLEQAFIALMIGSAAVAVMQLYALLKGP